MSRKQSPRNFCLLTCGFVFLSGTGSAILGGHAPKGTPAVTPTVRLIENERLKPEEMLLYFRSTLIEQGEGVAKMRKNPVNLSRVRSDINDYMTGYSVSVMRKDGSFAFSPEIKAWRANSTKGVSAWPPTSYPAARQETRAHAAGLEIIPVRSTAPDQLRVFFFPVRAGFDGRQYKKNDSAIAFYVHPQSGTRVTAMRYAGRTYVAVNQPLVLDVKLEIAQTETYPAVLGLGRVHVPAKFFAKEMTSRAKTLDREHPLGIALQELLVARRTTVAEQDAEKLIEAFGTFVTSPSIARQ